MPPQATSAPAARVSASIDPGGDADGAPSARGAGPARSGRAVRLLCAGLLVLLPVSAVVAVGLGTAVIPPADTVRYLWAGVSGGEISAGEAAAYQIVWEIRTPRVLLAALVGAGLSATGVAVQAIVRNALADPYVLGVSSGASVGAVGVMVTGGLAGLGVYAMSAGAFLGALAASVLVHAAAVGRGGLSPLRLILTGVAMALGFQAVMSVIVYLIPGNEATSTVLYWTMGSFGAASWEALPAVAGAVLAGLAVLHRFSRPLDVMALGDETAASLGVAPDRHRKVLLAVVSVVTGAMVAVSGAISFVGLVMPHLVRMVAGATHARVLAVAPLAGAVFMVAVDLVARTLAAPRELPLGVITALIGVPVFVTLMRRKSYVFGGR